MSTITTTARRTANLNIFIALAIVFIGALAFTVVFPVASPGTAQIPVTGNQNAYVEFLRGEKADYARLSGSGEALLAYHLGEQSVYTTVVDPNHALSTWRFGEKSFMQLDATESALLTYRQGEKEIR